MKKISSARLLVGVVIVISVLLVTAAIGIFSPKPAPEFDGGRALGDVTYQVSLGPRIPGSEAHTQIGAWLQAELKKGGWEVTFQELTYGGKPVRNVIARRGQGRPWIVIGAHYDTRFYADHDP